MKNLLQLLVNLIILCQTFYLDVFLVIWYGKLPKVSTYHRSKYDYKLKRSFEDEEYQNELFIKEHLLKFHVALRENTDLEMLNLKTNVPIYNNFHEEIGTQTLFQIIDDEYKKYLKTL